jgi:N4-gp56 family major capsid protein
MPGKVIPGTASAANLTTNRSGTAYTNVDLINTTTNYADTVASDSALRTEIWSELVKRDAREKNVLKDFIGGEGSGKPIVEKRDLAAGGSDKVTFTTVAPIRGQGVLGEEILKNSTESLKFGTFPVEVDLIRHAVSWTQVLKLMRFTGKTLDQLSSEVMSEWYARKEQDDSLYVARQTCALAGESNTLDTYGSNGATAGSLSYLNDGLSTDLLEHMKQNLIAVGGEPTNLKTDAKSGHEIPGYLFFAPDAGLRPLRGDSDYLNAITYADVRSGDNKLYSGEYAMWDNIMVYSHNNIIDTAKGRQGSPLAPTYYMKKTETLAHNASGATLGLSADKSDWFANFRSANLELISGETRWDDSGTMYFLAIKMTGAHRGKVKHYQYATNSLNQLKGVSATGKTFATAGNGIANTVSTVAFGEGDMIVQADSGGTPICYGLMMGKNALYYAKGAVEAEQIFHYDDFANSGNQAHLNSIGIQGVRGWRAYEDTDNRIPGLQMIEMVRQIPVITAG